MGKGSKRRHGKGYGDSFDRIFGEKKAVTSFKRFGNSGATAGRSGQHIIEDIQPFVSPITKEVISSRSQLREHNKRHGVTDTRDYSPEFMQKKQIEREQHLQGQSKADRADRIGRLVHEYDKHR